MNRLRDMEGSMDIGLINPVNLIWGDFYRDMKKRFGIDYINDQEELNFLPYEFYDHIHTLIRDHETAFPYP